MTKRIAHPIIVGGSLEQFEEDSVQKVLNVGHEHLGPLNKKQENFLRNICVNYFNFSKAEISPAGKLRNRADRAKKAVEKALCLITEGDSTFHLLLDRATWDLRTGERAPDPTILLSTVRRNLDNLLEQIPKKGRWQSEYGPFFPLIRSLIEFWEVTTGNSTRAPKHNWLENDYSGEQFEFIAAINSALDRAFNRESLGRQVAEIIARRSSSEKN